MAIYYEIFLSYKILTIGFIYFNSEKEGFKKKLKNCKEMDEKFEVRNQNHCKKYKIW